MGAVAKELFPQIDTDSKSDNVLGISIGFIIGLFFVNYLDYFVTTVENSLSCWGGSSEEAVRRLSEDAADSETKFILPTQGKSSFSSYNSLDIEGKHNAYETNSEGLDGMSDAGHDDPIILLATQAIAYPEHRQRVQKKIGELIDSISSMEQKSKYLHNYLNNSLPHGDAEQFADEIDEEIHRFQYSLDNCRRYAPIITQCSTQFSLIFIASIYLLSFYRLIQGSCTDIVGVVPRIWITDRGINAVKRRLSELKQNALIISDALNRSELNTDTLVDIHVGMDRMDNNLNALHQAIEGYSFKWGRRGKKRIIPVPKPGSFIPMGLIVPVIVDCIVDGFLVGSTSAVSPRAGIILGIANMIEMGFLGLAVSLRVSKCTASSMLARTTVLVMPPLIMLAAAVFGAVTGALARAHPVLYIGFISFGIVALLYLVVNELLVEAREAQGGKEYWWTAMILFVGIYSVILLDLVI